MGRGFVPLLLLDFLHALPVQPQPGQVCCFRWFCFVIKKLFVIFFKKIISNGFVHIKTVCSYHLKQGEKKKPSLNKPFVGLLKLLKVIQTKTNRQTDRYREVVQGKPRSNLPEYQQLSKSTRDIMLKCLRYEGRRRPTAGDLVQYNWKLNIDTIIRLEF